MESKIDPRSSSLAIGAPGVQEVPRLIEDVLRRLGATAVFGDPIHSNQTTVVPVADVRVGFGFGAGSGHSAEQESGGGGGGGGGGRVVPRGYIHIRPDGARFEPTLDYTRLALGAMACVAAVTVAIIRMRS